MLDLKTASVSELSRGSVNPVMHLILAKVQCDSSLLVIRQIEFTICHAMLKEQAVSLNFWFLNKTEQV